MAAGIPVVVSDWDGYKESVEDGEQGFKVPTVSAESGMERSLRGILALVWKPTIDIAETPVCL